jgi:transcription antitermination factor NusG
VVHVSASNKTPGKTLARIMPQKGVHDACDGDDGTPSVPNPRRAIKRRQRPKGWTPLSDWVIVRTKTGQENWASANCRQQEMETWLPRYHIPNRGKPAPLFPGYIFVRPNDQWRALRNTYGVIDIVMRGDGAPEYVPKVVMKELRKRADKDGIVTLPHQRTPKKGERVQIKVGAFQECFGLYDGLTPDGRIRVLMEFMSQVVTLEFRRVTSIAVID